MNTWCHPVHDLTIVSSSVLFHSSLNWRETKKNLIKRLKHFEVVDDWSWFLLQTKQILHKCFPSSTETISLVLIRDTVSEAIEWFYNTKVQRHISRHIHHEAPTRGVPRGAPASNKPIYPHDAFKKWRVSIIISPRWASLVCLSPLLPSTPLFLLQGRMRLYIFDMCTWYVHTRLTFHCISAALRFHGQRPWFRVVRTARGRPECSTTRG
jgi:hypothetical protein